MPDAAGVAVNDTGSGSGGLAPLQSTTGQAPCETCTRAGPSAPAKVRSRPAPLPGASLIVASGGQTCPVAPLQSP